MDLKKVLIKDITNKIRDLDKEKINATKSISELAKTDLNNAYFIVELNSAWEEYGEKNIKTEYKGKIQNAILQAKTEFKKVNNRSDVQADYKVGIKLGKNIYTIDKKYWVTYLSEK